MKALWYVTVAPVLLILFLLVGINYEASRA